jgi:hypothetical protein
MLEAACMKEEPNPIPQESSQSPGAPVANMGMGPGIGQANMGHPNMNLSQNVGQNMSQANMANMGQTTRGRPQHSMGQVNMSHHQQSMSQAAIAQQAQEMAQMDMSNIDPSIGLQHMGNLAPMGNPGRGTNMHGGGQMHDDRIDEMPPEM